MPYKLRRMRQGSKRGWVVVNSETGDPKSNHPLSHEDALAQLRALYVNVPDAKKSK